MDYEAIMEGAIKIATAHADRMYQDPNSKEWKRAFKERKHREYYLMTTPPNN